MPWRFILPSLLLTSNINVCYFLTKLLYITCAHCTYRLSCCSKWLFQIVILLFLVIIYNGRKLTLICKFIKSIDFNKLCIFFILLIRLFYHDILLWYLWLQCLFFTIIIIWTIHIVSSIVRVFWSILWTYNWVLVYMLWV